MRLRIWEIAAAVLGALFACVYLVGGAFVVGVGLLGAVLVWLVTRIRIEDDTTRPGHYASTRGALGFLKVFFVFVVYCAVGAAAFALHGDHTSTTRTKAIAIFALAGLALLLIGELQDGGNDAMNWLIGGEAEKRVGERLDTLKGDSWLVLHGYVKDRGGDIDHIVCGLTGAYAIETKSYGFRRRDLGQVKGNAWWLKEKLGVRWVTGVLCVADDIPPRKEDVIWVMGEASLVEWLRHQRNAGLDPAIARAILLNGDARAEPQLN